MIKTMRKELTSPRFFGLPDRPTLVSGLQWKPSKAAKSLRGSDIRKHSQTARGDVTHYVYVRSESIEDVADIGMFALSFEEAELSRRLPKAMHSAAAMFAAKVGRDFPAAALVLRVGDEADRGANRFLLVVLADGVPQIDDIADEEKLRSGLSDARDIFTDGSVELSGNHHEASLKWLYEAQSKATKLAEIPTDLVPYVVVAGLLVAASGGWFWMKHREKEALAEKLRIERTRKDPTPMYASLLATQAPQLLVKQSEIPGVMASIFSLRPFLDGWILSGVDCRLAQAAPTCTATWKRYGGDYVKLASQLPGHELVMVAEGPSTGQSLTPSNLDVATTKWPVIAGKIDLSSARAMFASEPAPLEVLAKIQGWNTASLAASMSSAQQWPEVPNLPPRTQLPGAIQRAAVKVSKIPSPFVQDVVDETPGSIFWNRITLSFSPEAAPESRLMMDLEGFLFVDPNSSPRTVVSGSPSPTSPSVSALPVRAASQAPSPAASDPGLTVVRPGASR